MSEKLTLREKLHIGEKRPDGEKPRMSKKLKKAIIAAACVVGVCGAVWGGLTIARNAQRGDVNVYAVNECAMTDYWGGHLQHQRHGDHGQIAEDLHLPEPDGEEGVGQRGRHRKEGHGAGEL